MKRIYFISMIGMAALMCSCQDSLEERCAKECETYTAKQCPAPIADGVVIDSLTFDASTHTMHYYYTMSGAADNPQAFTKINAPKMVKDQVRNATSLRLYKEAGYNFAYTYWSASRKGYAICEVVVTKKDYQ